MITSTGTDLASLAYQARIKGLRLEEYITLDLADEHLPFTDRESYLAWRAAWKQGYAKLSEEIRTAKQERSKLQKAGDPKGSDLQVQCARKRAEARLQCHLRRLSKEKAGKLQQETIEAAAVSL